MPGVHRPLSGRDKPTNKGIDQFFDHEEDIVLYGAGLGTQQLIRKALTQLGISEEIADLLRGVRLALHRCIHAKQLRSGQLWITTGRVEQFRFRGVQPVLVLRRAI